MIKEKIIDNPTQYTIYNNINTIKSYIFLFNL